METKKFNIEKFKIEIEKNNTKIIKNKNAFNRLAYRKYKEMFGIMPDKTPYFRLSLLWPLWHFVRYK